MPGWSGWSAISSWWRLCSLPPSHSQSWHPVASIRTTWAFVSAPCCCSVLPWAWWQRLAAGAAPSGWRLGCFSERNAGLPETHPATLSSSLGWRERYDGSEAGRRHGAAHRGNPTSPTSTPRCSSRTGSPAWCSEHRDWLLPNHYDEPSGSLKLSVHSWLLTVGGKRILIDTCVGNHKSRPHRPKWHLMETPYLARLKAAGVEPDQVDMVMCTHLHVDHVGWNTSSRTASGCRPSRTPNTCSAAPTTTTT